MVYHLNHKFFIGILPIFDAISAAYMVEIYINQLYCFTYRIVLRTFYIGYIETF